MADNIKTIEVEVVSPRCPDCKKLIRSESPEGYESDDGGVNILLWCPHCGHWFKVKFKIEDIRTEPPAGFNRR